MLTVVHVARFSLTRRLVASSMDRIVDTITLYTIENGMLTWCVSSCLYSGCSLLMWCRQHHDGRLAHLRESPKNLRRRSD